MKVLGIIRNKITQLKTAKQNKRIENFVNEYYTQNQNKGLVTGPLISTQDKLKQIQWHNTHLI